MRLVDQRTTRWRDRAHFFAISARIMRRVLVDHARAHLTEKRGGGAVTVSLADIGDAAAAAAPPVADLIAIDDSLARLEVIDPFKSALVQLRFFGGLDADEAAIALDCSRAKVNRHWRAAKAWLLHDLEQAGGADR